LVPLFACPSPPELERRANRLVTEQPPGKTSVSAFLFPGFSLEIFHPVCMGRIFLDEESFYSIFYGWLPSHLGEFQAASNTSNRHLRRRIAAEKRLSDGLIFPFSPDFRRWIVAPLRSLLQGFTRRALSFSPLELPSDNNANDSTGLSALFFFPPLLLPFPYFPQISSCIVFLFSGGLAMSCRSLFHPLSSTRSFSTCSFFCFLSFPHLQELF